MTPWGKLPPASQQAAVELAGILLRILERQQRDADRERVA